MTFSKPPIERPVFADSPGTPGAPGTHPPTILRAADTPQRQAGTQARPPGAGGGPGPAHAETRLTARELAQPNIGLRGPVPPSTLAGAQPASQQATQPGAKPAASDSDRRQSDQPTERMIGRITQCSGNRATISTSATNLTGASADFWAVGRLISIEAGKSRVVAMVYEMQADSGLWDEGNSNAISVRVELVGEVSDDGWGGPVFKRGVTRYPPLGAVAHRIRARDLEAMHDLGSRKAIEVGRLSQNDEIPASIAVDDMLRRHFAVLGTTGVGKSTSVSLLVRRLVEAESRLRVIMLDPHNEFGPALSDKAQLLDAATLDLPFWLFRFDELEDVVFRSRPVPDESDILRELVGLARAGVGEDPLGGGPAGPGAGGGSPLQRRRAEPSALTADTPTPYRINDVLRLIDEILGQLEPRFDRRLLRSLRLRIDAVISDPRYQFMFGRTSLDDSLPGILSRLFRLPAEGKPITVLNLSGLPSDVLNAVVSVLARLSFDVAYASSGAVQVLMVCEEAHRYVPQDESLGFLPTRRAIARIAKEGRKYGCAIAVVTQRPGELDPTILSQCSTVFAMRLTNDRDQQIIKMAISDSSASTISFLSALDNREAIAFGEAVAAPMRLRFAFVDRAMLPAVATSVDNPLAAVEPDSLDPAVLVSRIRHLTAAPVARDAAAGDMRQDPRGDSRSGEAAAPVSVARASLIRRTDTSALGPDPMTAPQTGAAVTAGLRRNLFQG